MGSDFDRYRKAFQQHLHAKSGEGKKPFADDELPLDLVVREVGSRAREKFVEKASLQPPPQVRLIDCKATWEQQRVVLVDWHVEQVDFSAISHTFGMEVYSVFDCECTSICLARVPRCSGKPCPQHCDRADPRNRVVTDILNMCAILYQKASVGYAWHDGVCIAQHNPCEVNDTIKNIGWVYAYAMETIIFLHYVGRPMAPIRNNGDLESRWQSRVWTLQEGAMSKRRRYCVRVGCELGDCQSLEEFEGKIALWYRDDSSEIAVIEEESFWKILKELHTVIVPLCMQTTSPTAWRWCGCILDCMITLRYTCFQFPSIAIALEMCSHRNSKHEGDRINSILALAGVKEFVAPKEVDVENSTIEFFRRQGQQGLARAVFTTNLMFNTLEMDGKFHTWVPSLSTPLKSVYESAHMGAHLGDILSMGASGGRNIYTSFVEKFIRFTVQDNGWIELRGELACVAVKLTVSSLKARSRDVQGLQQYEGPLVVLARADRPGLAMDLRVDIDGFKASLAQAPSLEMGTAVVPIQGRISWPDQESASGGDCCKSASWKSAARALLWKAVRFFLCCSDVDGEHGESSAAEEGATQQGEALFPSFFYKGGSQHYFELLLAGIRDHTCVCWDGVPAWRDGTPLPPDHTQIGRRGASREFARACSSMTEPGNMAVVPSVSKAGALAALTEAPAMELGMPVLPVLSGRANFRPLVGGREIQKGESLYAHLVFSVPALRRHQHDTDNFSKHEWTVPGLLVQGKKLKHPVYKIGCFDLNQQLKLVLTRLLPSLTTIDSLVIR